MSFAICVPNWVQRYKFFLSNEYNNGVFLRKKGIFSENHCFLKIFSARISMHTVSITNGRGMRWMRGATTR